MDNFNKLHLLRLFINRNLDGESANHRNQLGLPKIMDKNLIEIYLNKSNI